MQGLYSFFYNLDNLYLAPCKRVANFSLQQRTYGEFCNPDDLFETVPFTITEVSSVVVHRVDDRTIALKYLSCEITLLEQ